MKTPFRKTEKTVKQAENQLSPGVPTSPEELDNQERESPGLVKDISGLSTAAIAGG